MKKHITLTRSDRMTDAQKKIFDLLEFWGRYRLDNLAVIMTSIFTDEELSDPAKCGAKLYTLISGGVESDTVKTVSNASDPIMYETVVSAPNDSNDHSSDLDKLNKQLGIDTGH